MKKRMFVLFVPFSLALTVMIAWTSGLTAHLSKVCSLQRKLLLCFCILTLHLCSHSNQMAAHINIALSALDRLNNNNLINTLNIKMNNNTASNSLNIYIIGSGGPDFFAVPSVVSKYFPGVDYPDGHLPETEPTTLLANLLREGQKQLYERNDPTALSFALGQLAHYRADIAYHSLINRYGGYYAVDTTAHKRFELYESTFIFWHILDGNSDLPVGQLEGTRSLYYMKGDYVDHFEQYFFPQIIGAYYKTYKKSNWEPTFDFLTRYYAKFKTGSYGTTWFSLGFDTVRWASIWESLNSIGEEYTKTYYGIPRASLLELAFCGKLPDIVDYTLLSKPLEISSAKLEYNTGDMDTYGIMDVDDFSINDFRLYQSFRDRWCELKNNVVGSIVFDMTNISLAMDNNPSKEPFSLNQWINLIVTGNKDTNYRIVKDISLDGTDPQQMEDPFPLEKGSSKLDNISWIYIRVSKKEQPSIQPVFGTQLNDEWKRYVWPPFPDEPEIWYGKGCHTGMTLDGLETIGDEYIADLKPGTELHVEMALANWNGRYYGELSSPYALTINPIPVPPHNLRAFVLLPSPYDPQVSVDLRWDHALSGGRYPTVTGYNVYRKTPEDLESPGDKIGSTSAAETTFIDTEIDAGREYTYYIRSVTKWGVESVKSNLATVVIPDPPLVGITANPPMIFSGGSSTLTWGSTNATEVVASNFRATDVNGTTIVSPTETTTYTITVGGPGGEATASVTVFVSDMQQLDHLGILPSSLILKVGEASTVTVTAYDIYNNEFIDPTLQYIWSSGDPTIATVDGNGSEATVTGIAEGQTTVTVTEVNSGLTCSMVVTIQPFLNGGLIYGFVTDPFGILLSDVHVITSDGINNYETTTDIWGYYELYNVPAGWRVVTFYKQGCSTNNQIAVTEGGMVRLDAVLDFSSGGVSGPPIIQLNQPIVDEENLIATISGTITEIDNYQAVLIANTMESLFAIHPDGTFLLHVPLKEGRNTILIRATNGFGSTTSEPIIIDIDGSFSLVGIWNMSGLNNPEPPMATLTFRPDGTCLEVNPYGSYAYTYIFDGSRVVFSLGAVYVVTVVYSNHIILSEINGYRHYAGTRISTNPGLVSEVQQKQQSFEKHAIAIPNK